MTSLVGMVYVNSTSNTSVLASKNTFSIHSVSPGCTKYFFKDANVSFHRFPSLSRCCSH